MSLRKYLKRAFRVKFTVYSVARWSSILAITASGYVNLHISRASKTPINLQPVSNSVIPGNWHSQSAGYVLDIGMNTGQDTLAYASQGYNVIAVEANPLLVAKAKEILKDYIAEAKVKLLGVGIDSISRSWTTIPFYVNSHNDVFSSFNKELGCRSSDWSNYQASNEESCTEQHIFTLTCRDIIFFFGVPIYMKIDIEGRDLDCLKSLEGFPFLPKYISVEGLPNADLENMFFKLGYQKFKVVDQSIFADGASGPFGENCSDVFSNKKWLKWSEIEKREYPTIINGTVRHWYDIHAML